MPYLSLKFKLIELLEHISQLLECEAMLETPIFVFRRIHRKYAYEKNDFYSLSVCLRIWNV